MEAKHLATTIVSVSCKILITVLLLLVTIFAGNRLYNFGYDVFNEKAMSDESNAVTVTITIDSDDSASDIAHTLADRGMVNGWLLFFAQLTFSGDADDIISGTYTLTTDMLPSEIITMITTTTEEEK